MLLEVALAPEAQHRLRVSILYLRCDVFETGEG